jgi:transcriptional regulator with XRE-family HTH domain
MKNLDNIIQENFSSKERAEIRLKSKEKIASIRLQQVRKSHNVTQKELAQAMGLSQSALSELERRPNITLNAMQRYIEALGGHLEIKAIFKKGESKIAGVDIL